MQLIYSRLPISHNTELNELNSTSTVNYIKSVMDKHLYVHVCCDRITSERFDRFQ